MHRLLVFIVVASGFALSYPWSTDVLGVQSSCANSECFVAAGSSPIALVVAIALLVFLFTYPQRQYRPNDQKVIGVLRRFAAFLLDFAATMIITAPIAAVPTVIAEYLYTDTFQWSFKREFVRSTDTAVILPVTLGVFLAMFLYFYLHPKYGRQTLGQYILGYRVIAVDGSVRASFGKRVFLSFIGLCAWPVSLVLALRSEGKSFWWDAASDSKVVHAGS